MSVRNDMGMNVLFGELQNRVPDFPYHISIGEIYEDYILHDHDYSELFIIINGEAIHLVNDECYRVSAGDVYIIREKIVHGFTNVNHLSICNIMIKDDTLSDRFPDLKNLPGYQALFVLEPSRGKEHQYGSRLHLGYSSLQHMISVVDTMSDDYFRREAGFCSMFVSNLLNILVYLSRLYLKEVEESERKLPNITGAVSYMEKFYDMRISVSEFSKMAGVSTRHFDRVFKQKYGVSPVEYLIRLRINKAASMLRNTDMNITEIAMSNGFCDSTYFCKQFKSIVGATPTAFRKYFHKK